MGRRYHHIYSKICTKEEASVNCFFQFVLSCYSWISDPAENSLVETLPKTHNSECLNKNESSLIQKLLLVNYIHIFTSLSFAKYVEYQFMLCYDTIWFAKEWGMCGRIKNPYCSMTMSAEYRSKLKTLLR